MRVPLPRALVTTPIAHRGYHDKAAGRIENSPAAARAAIAAGYGIEMDLQLSADGVAMVFHDEDMTRLTGKPGLLSTYTTAELGRIRLQGGPDGIPRFAEILALVAGRVPLLVELKDQTLTMSDTDGRLEAATAAALAGYTGDVALMSFNPHCIAHLARLVPQVPRGLTTSAFTVEDWAPLAAATCDRLRGIPDYDRTLASFISHEAADLGRPRVAALRAGGAAILCWTIRSPDQETAALSIADNITFEHYAPALTSG